MPECASPETKAARPIYAAASSYAWVGDLPTKGLAVLAFGGWSLTELQKGNGGKFALPIRVHGPESFRLLALWTQKPGYVEQAHAALDELPEFLRSPTGLVEA